MEILMVLPNYEDDVYNLRRKKKIRTFILFQKVLKGK